MANSNKITIAIDADGRAYIEGMNSVEGSTRKLESTTASVAGRLKTHWLEVTAAAYGAYRLLEKGWNLAEMSAQYEEQRASLQAITGQADALISRIQTAANGMVSLSQAASTAAIGVMKGLRPDQLVELAEAAETLSNITGEKVPASFRQMTEAIVLGRERALENSIGIIDLNARFGEQVAKMREAEKQAARYALVMEQVREKQRQLGPSITSASDRMEQFAATVENLKITVGAFIIKGAAALIGSFQWIAAGALTAYQGVMKLAEGYEWLKSKLGRTEELRAAGRAAAERFREDARAAGEAAKELTGKAMNSWALLQSKGEDVVKLFGRVNAASAASPPPPPETAENNAFARGMALLDLQEERFFAEREKRYQKDAEAFRQAQADKLDAAREQAAAKLAAQTPPEVQTAGALPGELSELASMQRNMAALQKYYGARVQLLIAAGADETAIVQNIADAKLAAEQQTDEMRIAAASATAGMMANTMQSLFVATGSKSKELFLLYKAFAVTQAIISAHLGAAAMLAMVPATPFNFAMSKITLAMGYAQAAAIAAQNMSGSVGAVSSASGGASISTGSPAPVAYPAQQEENRPAKNITLILNASALDPAQVNWDKLMQDNILPALNNALDNNYTLDVRYASVGQIQIFFRHDAWLHGFEPCGLYHCQR